ncbi:MAG: hypothetical protein QOE45_2506 [Frankiaceae bacterium]|nr:hypothetical protein [Frankiaceae bacterium]
MLDLVADEFLGVYGQAREQGHSGAGLSIDMLRPRLWYLTPAGIERLVKALEALDIIQRTSEQRSGDEPAWRYNAAPDEPGEPGRTLRQRLPYDMDATAGDMEADT